jgi:three-Cys-motif partner protein
VAKKSFKQTNMFTNYYSSNQSEKTGHFNSKKIHTEIKHLILQETIKQSAIIANYFAKIDKFSLEKGQVKRYCYLDFYAGQGKFDDGESGSPMIALETTSKNVVNMPVSFIFCEKDKVSYDSLKLIMKNEKNVGCFYGNWSENSPYIFNTFANSQWGFAFIDPFNNFKTKEEFDILIDFFSQTTLKDMLFFFNIQSPKRMFTNYRQQVLDLFSATEEDINYAKHFSDEIFQKLVLAKVKEMKKGFVAGAAIPNSTDGKLNNSNTFYMMLITNSSGVIFSFYEAYAKALIKYKKCQTISLLAQTNMQEKILSLLDDDFYVSLRTLSKWLLSEFIGWKETNSIDMLPTKDNICNALNKLILDNKVCIDIQKDKDKYVNKRGLLIPSKAFQNSQIMESVLIAKL